MATSIAQRTRETITQRIPTLRRVMSERLQVGVWRAVRYLADQARSSLAQGQPVVSYKHYKWGMAASQAGSPPRRLSGMLANSIKTSVTVQKIGKIVGYVGTTLAHDRFLELGAYIPTRTAKRRVMMFARGTAQGGIASEGRLRARDRSRGLVFTRTARGFYLRPRPWLKPLISKHANYVKDIIGGSVTLNLTIK